MRGGSDEDQADADRPEGEEWASGRFWPLVVIGGVLGWLLLTGGAVPGLEIIEGRIPGTGGILTVGHLVLLALILVIGNFVIRIPREGGPVSGDACPDPPASDDDSEEEIGEEGEFPETESGRRRVKPDDRPVEDVRQHRGPSTDG